MNKTLIAIAVLIAITMAGPAPCKAQTSYSKVVSNDAPALYWNFDEGSGNAQQVMPITLSSTVNDLSPAGTATRVSHATMGSGLNLGNAASFVVGDYFMSGTLAAYTNSIAGPWAIEFWMRVQGSVEFQRNNYLINFGGGGGNVPAFLYDYIGGAQPRHGLEMFRGGSRTAAGPTVNDLNWHHVIFVFYGDGTVGVADRVDIYLDGTNAAQMVRGGFSSPLNLARLVVGTSAPQFAGLDGFEGELDEVAIYDLTTAGSETAVTTKMAQVASGHYARAKTTQSYSEGVLADQPLFYWSFDEASGNAHQLAPVQLPAVRNDLVPTGGADRISHGTSGSGLGLGQAAHFPAGGLFSISQLLVTNNPIAAPWMMEFWMQAEGNLVTHPRNDYLVNFGNNAPAVLYDYVGGGNTNGGGLELYSGGRTGSGPGIVDPNWHHVLFVYYGDGTIGVADRVDIYVDGTNAAQNIRNTFASPLTLSSLALGTSGAQFALADGFEGNMDEFAVYNLGALQTEAAVTAKAADIATRHFAAARQAAPPSLQIQRSGNLLVISWSASASGYSLESATAFGPSSWAPFGGTPTISDGRAQVTVAPTNTVRFFRLKQ